MRAALLLLPLLLTGCAKTYPEEQVFSAPAAPLPAESAQATPYVAPSLAVLFTDSGPGTQQTRRFEVTSSADVLYSYNCQAAPGLFQMIAYDAAGGQTYLANSQESKANTSTTINAPGVYYLSINSTCPWKLEVRG